MLGSVHGLTAGRSPPGVQPPSGGVGHQEQVGARLRWPSARQPHLSGIPAAGWLSPVGLATHNSPPDGVLRVRGLAGLGQRSSPPQAPARLASRLIKGYIYVAGLPTISASLPMRAGVVVCPADAVADRLHALRFDLASTEVSIRKALAKGDRGILKIGPNVPACLRASGCWLRRMSAWRSSPHPEDHPRGRFRLRRSCRWPGSWRSAAHGGLSRRTGWRGCPAWLR